MIKNFRHICLIVNNLEKSLKFYQDIIGLRVFKKATLEGEYLETLFNIKGIRLTYVKMHSPNQAEHSPPIFELHYWENPRMLPKVGYSHISFTIEDIDYEYKRLTELGVRLISKPIVIPGNNTKICFGYDPDNYLIEFVEELN